MYQFVHIYMGSCDNTKFKKIMVYTYDMTSCVCIYIYYDYIHMFCHATLYRRFHIICTASCQSSGCKIANLAALAFSFERIDLNAASPTFLGKRFPNPMVYLKSEHEDKSSYY